MKKTVIILAIALIAVATVVLAEGGYLNPLKSRYGIPNGSKLDSCNTCHGGPWPDRNVYGADLEAAGSDTDLTAAFDATDQEDSDLDGALNWAELVNGTWPGDDTDTTPTRNSTWGKIKALYN